MLALTDKNTEIHASATHQQSLPSISKELSTDVRLNQAAIHSLYQSNNGAFRPLRQWRGNNLLHSIRNSSGAVNYLNDRGISPGENDRDIQLSKKSVNCAARNAVNIENFDKFHNLRGIIKTMPNNRSWDSTKQDSKNGAGTNPLM